MKQLETLDPDNVYGVPYTLGTTGIGFNVEAIMARMPDAPLDSWKLIFDPTVVSKFKDCGVAMVDSGDSVVESALIYLGRNPNSEEPDDLRAAVDVIEKIQPFVRYFQSSSYIDDLANGEICLALGWSGDFYQAARSARSGVTLECFGC
jgi:putrescine transport system substrate-binding protein